MAAIVLPTPMRGFCSCMEEKRIFIRCSASCCLCGTFLFGRR